MSSRFSLLLCVLCVSAVNTSAADLPATIDFNRDIRPILSDKCFFCHGPDKNKRKSDLRLDTKEGLYSAIEQTRLPVVPGKPGESEIFKRITAEDEDDRMPQAKSGKSLSAREIGLIKKWIEQGAEFKGHWAYEKPTKPIIPTIQTPNPIDAFLLAKLAEHKLAFSKQADRVALIRRLYFDLLGKPPTQLEVDAFINDQSPNAYESLVDRLLANPHFGERMAVYWLDLVRFADTIGYHSDNPRDITPYRDWVINAFNSNMPFDRFTIEQIAGDLLPNPTIQQQVASAYNRLLQTTEEGGAQPKEYAAKYLADRVRNFASVWLAGTMGCAECHDHKFDPYTMKDFYGLAAFFSDVREPGVGRREKGMPVPDEAQAKELARFDGLIADVKAKYEVETPELSAAREKWEGSAGKVATWTVLTPVEATSANGALLAIGKDKSIKAGGKIAETDTYVVTFKTSMKAITALKLEVLADKTLSKSGPGRADNGNFVLTEFIVQTRDKEGAAVYVKLQNASATFEQAHLAEANPYKRWSIASAIDDDAKGANWGWAVLDKDNKVGKDQHAVFEMAADLGDGGETMFTVVLRQNHGTKHVLGKFRVAVTTSPRPVRAAPEMPREVVAALAVEKAKRNDAQKKAIAAHWRSIAPELASHRAELAKHEKARLDYENTLPRVLVSYSEKPAMVRVLPRGNWNTDSGEEVKPGTPHFMQQVSATDRATRLDLANWVVSKENPLTARVYVNRLWKMFFGAGISKTLEDLGSQGEWPTHPELLDWLACEFRDGGWDVKKMIRLMVTSHAYRQTSYASVELKQIDPFNRLIGRQGRWRIDAEFVRDNALAVAGLLSERIGGESVKPYQPAGYWDFLNFPTRQWAHDKGEKQYRRGLYTHWQRSFLHPSLLNFDATSREECTAERTRSNTPQQALTLLNDPTYVEAARVFAQRIMSEGGADVESRIAWAWKTAVARRPSQDEVAVLSQLYLKHKAMFAADRTAAEKLVSVGEAPRAKDVNVVELAAWTSVARTILNVHEAITRN